MINKIIFWCFDQPLVVWQRWENLKRIFFELSIIELLRKSKKKKKIQVFACFANLWDSGKSNALELEPKTFLILYLLIISFKNHYILEFMHIKSDGQTDRRTDGQTG
jgi:hypothetical protein